MPGRIRSMFCAVVAAMFCAVASADDMKTAQQSFTVYVPPRIEVRAAAGINVLQVSSTVDVIAVVGNDNSPDGFSGGPEGVKKIVNVRQHSPQLIALPAQEFSASQTQLLIITFVPAQ